MAKVIVAGPNDYNDKKEIYKNLDILLKRIELRSPMKYDGKEIELVIGDVGEFDNIVKQYAMENDLFYKVFQVYRGTYGKFAFAVRDEEMAHYATDSIIFEPTFPTKETICMKKNIGNKCKMNFIVSQNDILEVRYQ